MGNDLIRAFSGLIEGNQGLLPGGGDASGIGADAVTEHRQCPGYHVVNLKSGTKICSCLNRKGLWQLFDGLLDRFGVWQDDTFIC